MIIVTTKQAKQALRNIRKNDAYEFQSEKDYKLLFNYLNYKEKEEELRRKRGW